MERVKREEGQAEHAYRCLGEVVYFLELPGNLIGDGVVFAGVAIGVGDFVLIEVAQHFEPSTLAGAPSVVVFLSPGAH